MTDQITFNASSTSAKGVGAHVNVIVDGNVIGSTMVGTATQTYVFNTTLSSSSTHNIQIVYDNDTVVRGEDRNLTLNSIGVNGQTIAATSANEVYHALGEGDFASSGAMNWSGTAEFNISSSSSSALPPSSPGAPTTDTVTGPGFYVSPYGNDNGDGSAGNPFATLAKAVSAMASSDIHTTYLEDGTYRLTSTVNIGSNNSGDTVAAAPGATAILDGGGQLDTLVHLNGASDVTLQGLTFQNTGSGRAALTLDGASGNHVIANHFTDTGEALLLNNGSSNNTVSGNQLDNSGSSAVEVQDGSNANLFDSNIVNGTGAIGTKGGGFFLHGVNDNVISHNLVENTAGIGIGIENWDSDTINIGNSVIGNIVRNTNISADSTDSGAIYELGRSGIDTQSVISDNYVIGNSQGSDSHLMGIYLDDFTSGVNVKNNIVTGFDVDAMQIHGGSNVTIHNNIIVLGSDSGSTWGGGAAVLLQGEGQAMTGNSITGNIIASTSSTPLSYVTLNGGTASIDSNFYMDQLNDYFRTDGGSLPESNAQYGNAEFANLAGGDFTIASGSAVSQIGFTAIDQSAMGPHPTTSHWYA